MKVLLTGAASFTGHWFASALANAGHEVIAPLRGAAGNYEGVRRDRITRLPEYAKLIEHCPFGSDRFLELLRGGTDVLCHHAALVTNYRSADFDVCAALHNNTLNLPLVLRVGRESGLKAIVLTGTVFEPDEGAGSTPLRAFSPYGLSKALTAQVFRFWCGEFGIPLAKFVIPNPFGPLEEERFCAHLMRCWAQGKSASIKTPAYVRDNIHVSLLALAYADLVARADSLPATSRLTPSGYAESQGAFARRLAYEVGRRLDIEAELNLASQTEFPEPQVRIGTDIPDAARFGWDESAAWDELAEYYRARYLEKR